MEPMPGAEGGGMPPAASGGHAWTEHIAPDGRKYYYNSVSQESTWERPPELAGPPMAPASAAPVMMPPMGGPVDYGAAAAAAAYGHGHPGGYPPIAGGYGGNPGAYGHPAGAYGHPAGAYMYGPAPVGPGAPIQTTKHSQGPPGCNLFIFHIPNDMTNRELYSIFAPFGNVISARIMVDRDTGRSRGFGFVSYDNTESAAQAIIELDGAKVGKKRLKVAHKKEKGTYDHSRRAGGDDGGAATGGDLAASTSTFPAADTPAPAPAAVDVDGAVRGMESLAVTEGGAAPAADAAATADAPPADAPAAEGADASQQAAQ